MSLIGPLGSFKYGHGQLQVRACGPKRILRPCQGRGRRRAYCAWFMVAQSAQYVTGLALMTQFVMHGWCDLELSLLERAPASQGYLLQQPTQQTKTLKAPSSHDMVVSQNKGTPM